MKIKKVFCMVLIFAIIVSILPQNVYAYNNMERECSVQEQLNGSKSNSDAVLAYYDVKTQTETLFTEKDLQETISEERNKGKIIGTSVEPQKATKSHVIHNLTKEEVERFEVARENTKEYYGIETSNIRAVDNRTLVSNPQADPYYRIAKLYFNHKLNASGTDWAGYVGTGFAIGYDLCATARHCLTDNYGNWATDFKAYYGYNGNNNTYCDLLKNVSAYIYYPQYITGKNADGTIQVDSDFDIAFVVWDKRTLEETGCFGMSSGLSEGMRLLTAGYPADRDNGNRMYRSVGSVSSFTDFRLRCNNIFCYPGQSGSAYYDSSLYAHGVITHTDLTSSGSVSGESSGRRFDSTLIEWLISAGHI